jgi:hypothetical protein
MKNVKIQAVRAPQEIDAKLQSFVEDYKNKGFHILKDVKINFDLQIPVCLFVELFNYHPVGWMFATNSNKYNDLSFYEPSAWKNPETDATEKTTSGVALKDTASSLGKTLHILSKSSVEILQLSEVTDPNLFSLMTMGLYRRMYLSVSLWDLVALNSCELFAEMSFGAQEYITEMLLAFEQYCTNPEKSHSQTHHFVVTH